MKGGDAGVPYAAYIHPSNADSGAYGGMCFVIFQRTMHRVSLRWGSEHRGLRPTKRSLDAQGMHGRSRHLRLAKPSLRRRCPGGVGKARSDTSGYRYTSGDSKRMVTIRARAQTIRQGVIRNYRPTAIAPGPSLRSPRCSMYVSGTWLHAAQGIESDAQSVQSAWFEHLMPLTAPDDVVGC